MSNRLFIRIKILINDPFIISIFFTLIANFIQVIAFAKQSRLDDYMFGLLNWGVYIFTLLNIPIELFTRWLTIELSKKDLECRWEYVNILFSRLWKFFSLITVIPILLMLVFHVDHMYILIFSVLTAFVGLITSFFRAILATQNRFFEFNSLNMVLPLFRLFSTIIFIPSGQIDWVFGAFLFSSILSLLICICFFVNSRDINWAFFRRNIKTINNSVRIEDLLGSLFMQLMISVFWVFDGILLYRLLSQKDYAIYTSYSYVYKFPLFVSISLIPVFLGENILDAKDNFKIDRLIKKILVLVASLYFVSLSFDYLTNGLILRILGYARYLNSNISLILGMSWFTQTICFFLFSYDLKIHADNTSIKKTAILYFITFVSGLFIFSFNLQGILKFIFWQGIVFAFIILFIRNRNKKTYGK